MATIMGTTFADLILGTALADLIKADAGSDTVFADDGNDTVYGGEGDDTLDGGLGIDRMYGGAGNDHYFVNSTGETVSEGSGAGIDTVHSTVDYTLGTNVENLELLGADNLKGTGNALANHLIGNSGKNTLNGGDGNDTIEGGNGDDTINGQGGVDFMRGGDGNDLYWVNSASDVVVDSGIGDIDRLVSYVTYTLPDSVDGLFLIGSNAINGTGNSNDNYIAGNNSANKIDGGAGVDILSGQGGNDTYVVDNLGDIIWENTDGGTDLVLSSVTHYLFHDVENLTLTGTDDIAAYGNDQNNKLTGNSGANVLDGLAGRDTMAGGLGDDVYIIDTSGELITEAAGAGFDVVFSEVSYTLAANVEILMLQDLNSWGVPTGNINGTGNNLANEIRGNIYNNVLSGGTGADTLTGGGGNDTYIIDNVGDVVIANFAGLDTVKSSVSYVLGTDVENLTLTGTSGLVGTGNDLDNMIVGNSGANALYGGDGDDTLNGGLGTDKLYGGNGDDTYIVNATGDVALDSGVGDIDTVISAATYTLSANLENLTLTGALAVINGTGNGLDNILTGQDGANILNGLGGEDTMIGGAGPDTYVVDHVGDVVEEVADEGTDSVQASITYTLGENAEWLFLTGTAAIDGTGNALDNTIKGNSGNNELDGADGNDVLDGGAGNDTLIGGAGNDSYFVNSAGDVVIEAGIGDVDTVYSSVTYTLGAELENLVLQGSAAISGFGNSGDNLLIGNSANNSLTGNDGNDTLNGGSGSDKLYGGNGNDTYVINSTGDIVNEAGGLADLDTVQSSITYTLGATVENLTLTGTGAINGTGNASANALTGNNGANKLSGLDGDDILVGGNGNDTLTGGNGSDAFVRHSAAEGNDTITDFQAGAGGDILDLADLLIGYVEGVSDINDFIICIDTGGSTTVQVDVDGADTTFGSSNVCILSGVVTTAADLLADGNLVVT